MNKEIFIDNRHDYNLEIKDETYSLYYSPDEAWTRPNGFVMSITDTGNELKIKKMRKTNKLDYDEAVELSILLRAYYFLRGEKFEMVDTKIEL